MSHLFLFFFFFTENLNNLNKVLQGRKIVVTQYSNQGLWFACRHPNGNNRLAVWWRFEGQICFCVLGHILSVSVAGQPKFIALAANVLCYPPLWTSLHMNDTPLCQWLSIRKRCALSLHRSTHWLQSGFVTTHVWRLNDTKFQEQIKLWSHLTDRHFCFLKNLVLWKWLLSNI